MQKSQKIIQDGVILVTRCGSKTQPWVGNGSRPGCEKEEPKVWRNGQVERVLKRRLKVSRTGRKQIQEKGYKI